MADAAGTPETLRTAPIGGDDTSNEADDAPIELEAPQIDEAELRMAFERLKAQQNLAGGLIFGGVASLLSAAIWAGVTVGTGYQIGWMAIGVGVLVGLAVRTGGKGMDTQFGILGGGLSLVGCALGNLLAVCGLVAQQEGIPFASILGQLNGGLIQELMVATFSPMDVLFYGLAVWQGYKLAFRQVSQEELMQLLPSLQQQD